MMSEASSLVRLNRRGAPALQAVTNLVKARPIPSTPRGPPPPPPPPPPPLFPRAVFDMLAFKNDIGFWKNNKSMKGLSGGGEGPLLGRSDADVHASSPRALLTPWCSLRQPNRPPLLNPPPPNPPNPPNPLTHPPTLLSCAPARSVLINAFCQLVIFLYLLDSETSMVVLFSSGVGMLIEFWKVSPPAPRPPPRPPACPQLGDRPSGVSNGRRTASRPARSTVPRYIPAIQVTKAMNVKVTRTASGLPWLSFEDRASYKRSKTDQYDASELPPGCCTAGRGHGLGGWCLEHAWATRRQWAHSCGSSAV